MGVNLTLLSYQHYIKRKIQGVTLIELMAVLAIAAIIALIAIPSFTNPSQTTRLKLSADEIYYRLLSARAEAIKQNTTVYVLFKTGTSWCYGISTGTTCNCSIPTTCNLGTVTASNALLSLATTNLSSNSLYFESTHGNSSLAGTIVLSDTKSSNTITAKVSLTGAIQLCSSTIAGYQACP